jgi:hypothetical protein
MLGGFIGFIFGATISIIGMIFIIPQLGNGTGAMKITSGLAKLGNGNVSSGGSGMIGGIIVIGCTVSACSCICMIIGQITCKKIYIYYQASKNTNLVKYNYNYLIDLPLISSAP